MKTDYQYKYIYFRDCSGHMDSLKIYACRNSKSHGILGYVKWYGAWRGYCFFPTLALGAELVFSAGCLTDIADFIKQLMETHRRRGAKEE